MAQSDVRPLIETSFKRWLTAAFASLAEFTPPDGKGAFTIYAGRRQAQLDAPCLVASCESAEETEGPGTGLFRAPLNLVLMTSIDEDEPDSADWAAAEATHRERLNFLTNRMQGADALAALAAAALGSGVYAFQTASASQEDRKSVV